MKKISFLVVAGCVFLVACIFEKGDGTYGGRRDNGVASSGGSTSDSECPTFTIENGTACVEFPQGLFCPNQNASGQSETCTCTPTPTAQVWVCR